MRIVACLSWYDEPTAFLYRCVRSLEGLADELIAVDGPWQHFPSSNGSRSPSEQYETINATRRACGIGGITLRPGRPWGSQVEKRNTLMEIASAAAGKDGWLFVIDGDEYVHWADASDLRRQLDRTERDVALVSCVRTTGVERVNIPRPIRRIYRASTGVGVHRAHNGYRTADGRWLHGDPAYVRVERAFDASPLLTLHHEQMNRGDERNAARLAYRSARRREGIESWVA